jgi:hypothetical protein
MRDGCRCVFVFMGLMREEAGSSPVLQTGSE